MVHQASAPAENPFILLIVKPHPGTIAPLPPGSPIRDAEDSSLGAEVRSLYGLAPKPTTPGIPGFSRFHDFLRRALFLILHIIDTLGGNYP